MLPFNASDHDAWPTYYYRLRLIGSLYLPRPPVEQCTVADRVALRHEGDAAFADNLVEAVDGLEVCVGERSSTNCQRCSAGCSSGLCEGWNTRRMPSGRLRFCGPCQPAWSSWITARFLLPTPIDLAKSASTASNISLHTAFETFHIVRPVVGSTKP